MKKESEKEQEAGGQNMIEGRERHAGGTPHEQMWAIKKIADAFNQRGNANGLLGYLFVGQSPSVE